MDNIKKIVNFLFELSGAKTTSRTGWQRIGIKVSESLADHTALSGQIAYVLALMEGANPDRAASLAIFHDTAELRMGDRNWVFQIYSGDEKKRVVILDDQLSGLPITRQFKEVFEELNEGKTKEAIIAGDADLLDMAIQSKIYTENGNKKAALWSESIKNKFATKSAREIFSALEFAGSEDWWMGLEAMKNKFDSFGENK